MLWIWNFHTIFYYILACFTPNFVSIAYSYWELWIIKVWKLDVCGRPLFANLVTYGVEIFLGKCPTTISSWITATAYISSKDTTVTVFMYLSAVFWKIGNFAQYPKIYFRNMYEQWVSKIFTFQKFPTIR